MSDEETLQVYARRAADYAKMVSRDTPDHDLRSFMEGVPAGGRVLDLGCGPGNSAAMMQSAGLEAEAWDASPEMIDLARKVPGLSARVARFEDLDAVGAYDGIWANFSLLHAPRADMPENLDRITRALRADGLLHLGLKTGSGEVRDKLGRLYSYFSETEIRDLLTPRGFTIVSARHGAEAGLDGTVAPYMILKARLI